MKLLHLLWKHRHVMNVRTTYSTCFKIKQDRQITYNVTLSSVRVTVVAVEKH